MASKKQNQENHLADSVIGKIDAKRLKPESRSKILYKSFSLYLVIAMGLAALSLIAVVALNTFRRNLFLESAFENSKPGTIFFALPWGLIIFTVLALGLIIFLISKTEFGYKYRKPLLIPAALIFLGLMTSLIYAGGVRHSLTDNHLKDFDDKGYQRFRGKVIEVNQSELKLEDGPGKTFIVKLNANTDCHPDDCDHIKPNQLIAGWAEKQGDQLLAKDVQTRAPRQRPGPGNGRMMDQP